MTHTPFSGPLAAELARFTATLEAGASANRTTLTQLRALDRFVQEHALWSGTIDEPLAKAWLAPCASRGPNTRRARYYLLRRVCRFLAKRRSDTFVPGESLRPRGRPSKPPYIYSRAEMRLLLDGAWSLRDWERWHPCPIRSNTMHAIILLLATSGLRISEALHLTLQDVDLDDGVLSIRQTKFRKSRLVPLSTMTRQVLRRYREVRLAVAPAGPAEAFSSRDVARPTVPAPSKACFVTSPYRQGSGRQRDVAPDCTTSVPRSPSHVFCSGTATEATSWPACRC
jgi:integrase